MEKKIIKLLFIPLIGFTSVSCGTFAGIGKDIQSVGKTMQNTENRRVWGIRKAPQPNYGYTAPAQPNYPAYPTYR